MVRVPQTCAELYRKQNDNVINVSLKGLYERLEQTISSLLYQVQGFLIATADGYCVRFTNNEFYLKIQAFTMGDADRDRLKQGCTIGI